MTPIRIYFTQEMDGYTFSLRPSVREYIKKSFRNSHPANRIFVGYDTKSDFEKLIGKLENHIFPTLLGITNQNDLSRIKEIEYINSQTDKVVYTLHPAKIDSLI